MRRFNIVYYKKIKTPFLWVNINLFLMKWFKIVSYGMIQSCFFSTYFRNIVWNSVFEMTFSDPSIGGEGISHVPPQKN
jgi:hypothetical protein